MKLVVGKTARKKEEQMIGRVYSFPDGECSEKFSNSVRQFENVSCVMVKNDTRGTRVFVNPESKKFSIKEQSALNREAFLCRGVFLDLCVEQFGAGKDVYYPDKKKKRVYYFSRGKSAMFKSKIADLAKIESFKVDSAGDIEVTVVPKVGTEFQSAIMLKLDQIAKKFGGNIDGEMSERYARETLEQEYLAGKASPKEIKSIWDNGGDSIDRYRIVLHPDGSTFPPNFPGLNVSESPDHPQGVSMWTEVCEGDHLGNKLEWDDLPMNIQSHIRSRLSENLSEADVSGVYQIPVWSALISGDPREMKKIESGIKKMARPDHVSVAGRKKFASGEVLTVHVNAKMKDGAIKTLEDVLSSLNIDTRIVEMKVSEANITGKPQIMIMDFLKSEGIVGDTMIPLVDLMYQKEFRLVHFKRVMQAAEALKKKGLVNFNGNDISLVSANESSEVHEFAAKAHGGKKKTWTFTSSSNPNKKYTTVLWDDGTWSCDCPGWKFKRGSKPRICKHIKKLGGEPYQEGDQEKRWVYGTRDKKWHLVASDDRDFEHGISQEEFKRLGKEKAQKKYLRSRLVREGLHEAAMPKEIKSIWDNGEESADRYTVVLKPDGSTFPPLLPGLGLSDNPDQPQGVSMWTEVREGKHLGKKLKWNDLPASVQKHISKRLTESAELDESGFLSYTLPQRLRIKQAVSSLQNPVHESNLKVVSVMSGREARNFLKAMGFSEKQITELSGGKSFKEVDPASSQRSREYLERLAGKHEYSLSDVQSAAKKSNIKLGNVVIDRLRQALHGGNLKKSDLEKAGIRGKDLDKLITNMPLYSSSEWIEDADARFGSEDGTIRDLSEYRKSFVPEKKASFVADDLPPGTSVKTPKNRKGETEGKVNYVRLAPPDYKFVQVVSVEYPSRIQAVWGIEKISLKENLSEYSSDRWECQECGKVFTKKVGPRTYEIKCPKCKSTDIDIALESVKEQSWGSYKRYYKDIEKWVKKQGYRIKDKPQDAMFGQVVYPTNDSQVEVRAYPAQFQGKWYLTLDLFRKGQYDPIAHTEIKVDKWGVAESREETHVRRLLRSFQEMGVNIPDPEKEAEKSEYAVLEAELNKFLIALENKNSKKTFALIESGDFAPLASELIKYNKYPIDLNDFIQEMSCSGKFESDEALLKERIGFLNKSLITIREEEGTEKVFLTSRPVLEILNYLKVLGLHQGTLSSNFIAERKKIDPVDLEIVKGIKKAGNDGNDRMTVARLLKGKAKEKLLTMSDSDFEQFLFRDDLEDLIFN